MSYLADCGFTVRAVEFQRLPVVAATRQAELSLLTASNNCRLWPSVDVTEGDHVMSRGGGGATVNGYAGVADENVAVTAVSQCTHLVAHTGTTELRHQTTSGPLHLTYLIKRICTQLLQLAHRPIYYYYYVY